MKQIITSIIFVLRKFPNVESSIIPKQVAILVVDGSAVFIVNVQLLLISFKQSTFEYPVLC